MTYFPCLLTAIQNLYTNAFSLTSMTYKTTIPESNTITHHSKITIVPSTNVQEYYANHCVMLVSQTLFTNNVLITQVTHHWWQPVGIKSRSWAGRSRVQFLAWTRDFSLLKRCPHQHWGTPKPLFNGEYKFFLPEAQYTGCEDYHTPLSNAKAKNEWSYTSTPHTLSWHRQGLQLVPSNSTVYCMLQYMMESNALI